METQETPDEQTQPDDQSADEFAEEVENDPSTAGGDDADDQLEQVRGG